MIFIQIYIHNAPITLQKRTPLASDDLLFLVWNAKA